MLTHTTADSLVEIAKTSWIRHAHAQLDIFLSKRFGSTVLRTSTNKINSVKPLIKLKKKSIGQILQTKTRTSSSLKFTAGLSKQYFKERGGSMDLRGSMGSRVTDYLGTNIKTTYKTTSSMKKLKVKNIPLYRYCTTDIDSKQIKLCLLRSHNQK